MAGSGFRKSIRKKQVLFIHSGGSQKLHQGSSDLVAWLQRTLGAAYEVRYPKMPDPDHPSYDLWKNKLARELDKADDGLICIGHSLGGSVLLKYLSEENCPRSIDALFIVASPYWGKKDWRVKEYVLQPHFARQLPAIPHIFLYHSRQDAVVPFSHLASYAEQLPQAILRTFNSNEHLFSEGLPELVKDILELTAIHN
jgi:predicted alpha/beta hydrolase family esterase